MNTQNPELRERYRFLDYLYYSSLLAVPFFTAFYAIYNLSSTWLGVYIVMCLVCIALIYRHYCSHCPHYTREGKTTQCMFFWGVPKFFQRRPGRLGFLDKSIALAAPAVVIIFPLYWLFQQPGLLIIFILSLLVFFATMRRNECRRCVFFDSPVNKVPDELKSEFQDQ